MSAGGTSRAARFFKAGVGAFLVTLGLGVTALLFVPYRRAMETRQWTTVPCVVTRSELQLRQMGGAAEWRVLLGYEYGWAGQKRSGTRWRRVAFLDRGDAEVSRKSAHREVAESLVAKYPVGMQTQCQVNPADPAEAVLEHHTKAPIYTLWWPMLFAAGGAGILWSAFRRPERMDQRNSALST